jgi:pilus assembly protein CpaB
MLKKINFRALLGNSWILLFVAVLIAGGLTFVLYKYLTDREDKLKADLAARRVSAGIQVVVPAHDVPAGTPLSSGEFVSREIESDMAYDDMIRVDDFPKYRTSHLAKPLRRGLPLRISDVDALRGRDFSDILPIGQRALTVEIDTVNSTALLVRPGNRVDLYWIGKVFHEGQSSDDKKVTQLLLPDVLVLATGQDMRPRDAGEAAEQDQANANSSAMSRHEGMGFTTVTLQIPVDDIPRVALAQKIGGLRLILRNTDDKGSDGPALAKESDVFVDPDRTSAGSASSPGVEVITGGGVNNTVITPQGTSSPPTDTKTPAYAPPNAAQSPSGLPSDPTAYAHQPSLFEQANAIAQQLQQATRSKSSVQNQ